MRCRFVPTLVTVTVAPGTAAPAWSFTIPVISQPATCALREEAPAARQHAVRTHRRTTHMATNRIHSSSIGPTAEDCTSDKSVIQIELNRLDTYAICGRPSRF